MDAVCLPAKSTCKSQSLQKKQHTCLFVPFKTSVQESTTRDNFCCDKIDTQ